MIVLGGDGTVNEVVNGLLADGVDVGAPALAVVPGGSTNVFARAIGMPDDHVEATGHLLEALRAGRERSLGLGRADQRWFTFTAGLGLDADVVAQVERKREAGRRSTHALYVRTALRSMAGREARRATPLQLADLERPRGRSGLTGSGRQHLPMDVPRPAPARSVPRRLLRPRPRPAGAPAGAAAHARCSPPVGCSPRDRGRPEGEMSSTATTSTDSPSPRPNRSPSRSTVTTSVSATG